MDYTQKEDKILLYMFCPEYAQLKYYLRVKGVAGFDKGIEQWILTVAPYGGSQNKGYTFGDPQKRILVHGGPFFGIILSSQ